MPIDASIYSQIKQPEDPLTQYGKFAQLKNLIADSKLKDLQGQQAQTGVDEAAAVKNTIASAPQGSTLESLLPDIMRASPGTGLQYQKSVLENKKATSDIAHQQAQTAEIKHKAVASSLAMALQDTSDAGIQRAGEAYSLATGEPHDQMTAKILSIPQDKRKQFLISSAATHPAGLTALEALLGETKTTTTSPDFTTTEVATNKLGGAGLNPAPKTPGVKPPIDLGKISRADLEAGYRYSADGSLPPNMGRGMQGAAQATHIRDISAKINESLGISPEDIRANQAAFKASGGALLQLVKREAGVGANVKNFDFNADQALQLSDKVDRTGVPVVNKWILAGRRAVQGDPDTAAFDVAVKTTVNEFAQIVSGTTAGATTEGEKQKAEKLLSAAQNPQQIKAVINQMRIESQNRMKSFADQKQEVLNNMRGKKTPSGSPKIDDLLKKYGGS